MTAIASPRATEPSTTIWSFEFWPSWLFYIPVVIFWIILGIRHKSFTLPTAANPHVETGGLCGERKTSILDEAGLDATAWIAPYIVLRTGESDLTRAMEMLAAAQLQLPLVVKPNIGCNGAGVRLVQSVDVLADTLGAFPRDIELVLQELVTFEGEAGIFYIREPGELTGRITSLTLKQAPILTGDGRSTIRELVLENDRSRRIPDVYMPRLEGRLQEVLRAGECLRLVFAGNHCKGSIFTNGYQDITEALRAKIDLIMRDIPEFHFGRLDVRFESRAALRSGTGFRIIEINGVGSEATHIWDHNTRLFTAYRDQFYHYIAAFKIGAKMRQQGRKPTGIRQLFFFWRMQKRLMASYPMND